MIPTTSPLHRQRQALQRLPPRILRLTTGGKQKKPGPALVRHRPEDEAHEADGLSVAHDYAENNGCETLFQPNVSG